MSALLSVYHALPGWARTAAASAYGISLRAWRYAPETELQVAEVLERDRWPQARLDSWRQERLTLTLHRAATQVPYYRELWSKRRQKGDFRSWAYLENWPILEKQEVRLHSRAFVADDGSPYLMRLEKTSGTTGTPLKLYRSRRTLVARYAVYEARHRDWYGVSRRDRWAMLGTQLVTPAEASRPPYWVWNAPLRQLYVSYCHLAPEQAAQSLREIARRRCRYLWGYPSSLDALAQAALQGLVEPPRLEVVVTNAEPLLTGQRERIERAFGCPVRETYGMVELVAAAGECPSGGLHAFPEFGWIETLADDGRFAEGRPGEIIATSLLDQDMPLIRYRTGDRGTLLSGSAYCPCGRTLPLLQEIEGRQDDVVYSLDGRPIGRLDPIFKGDLRIREAQVIQEADGAIRMLVAPEPGFSSRDREILTYELRRRIGPTPVTFELFSRIPRGPNGKFRAVISHMSPPRSAARAAAC